MKYAGRHGDGRAEDKKDGEEKVMGVYRSESAGKPSTTTTFPWAHAQRTDLDNVPFCVSSLR